MFNSNTVGRFSLTTRTFGATDQPGDVHADMVGVMYAKGGDGQNKEVAANLVIDEETGKKHLSLLVRDNGDGICFVGKLFRDTTVQDKDQYIGFLRQRIETRLGGEHVYLSDWQLEISLEATRLTDTVMGFSGNVYPPCEAARYSANPVLRKSSLPF